MQRKRKPHRRIAGNAIPPGPKALQNAPRSSQPASPNDSTNAHPQDVAALMTQSSKKV